MVEVGYYNGKIGPLEEMQIPMLDRACYFGDGVYDFAMYHEGKVFALMSIWIDFTKVPA